MLQRRRNMGSGMHNSSIYRVNIMGTRDSSWHGLQLAWWVVQKSSKQENQNKSKKRNHKDANIMDDKNLVKEINFEVNDNMITGMQSVP
jgi:hypothetical protein